MLYQPCLIFHKRCFPSSWSNNTFENTENRLQHKFFVANPYNNFLLFHIILQFDIS